MESSLKTVHSEKVNHSEILKNNKNTFEGGGYQYPYLLIKNSQDCLENPVSELSVEANLQESSQGGTYRFTITNQQ